jgi:hypothetical protein
MRMIDVDSKDKLQWQPSDPDKIWNARVEAAAVRPFAELRVVGIHRRFEGWGQKV